jgi:predicted nucleic acid-binding protein
MVFVDTWAWIALAFRRDQHHDSAKLQHAAFLSAGAQYVTTEWVVSETTTQLYRLLPAAKAQEFINAILSACDSGEYRLIHTSREQFFEAWKLRKKYAD